MRKVHPPTERNTQRHALLWKTQKDTPGARGHLFCLQTLNAIQKWIVKGISPTIKESRDGDILRKILEQIELGLFTLFVKIKSHRGEFFNKMADRWANKGMDTM